MIIEGSYPYVVGGVSSWVNTIISNMPDQEFIIYSIGAQEKEKGNYKYKLPPNVTKIEEVFLDSILNVSGKYGKKYKLPQADIDNLSKLISGGKINWDQFFLLFRTKKIDNVVNFFLSFDFFRTIQKAYGVEHATTPFTEYFWTVRAVLLPLFHIVKHDIPEADVYHSVSTGYAGIIGSMASIVYKKPFLLTEHGIYFREREEDIIKLDWIKGYFKRIWIQFFYNATQLTYDRADKVITLFEKNRKLQVDYGCDPKKIEIIPNGISIKNFKDIARKDEKDNSINIGALIRVVPIKDVMTLIHSFAVVKDEIPEAKLYIMGPIDEDEEYYEQCKKLVQRLGRKDVFFTGTIKTLDYVGKMDILALSSISESNPIAVLEGMACAIPYVCTDVGNCRDLMYGTDDGAGDTYGYAGIIVPVMDYKGFAKALIKLIKDEGLRKKLGQNGFNRLSNLYIQEQVIEKYKDIYASLYQESKGR
jgi:glycosyltransferase involved in cell wall biosynthesis